MVSNYNISQFFLCKINSFKPFFYCFQKNNFFLNICYRHFYVPFINKCL